MISSLYSNSWDWLLHSWCSATPPHTYNIIILTVLSPAEQLSPGHQDSPCQRKVGESKRGDPDTADTAAPALSDHCSSLNKTWWVEGKSPLSNIFHEVAQRCLKDSIFYSGLPIYNKKLKQFKMKLEQMFLNEASVASVIINIFIRQTIIPLKG